MEPYITQASMTLISMVVTGIAGYLIGVLKKRSKVEQARLEIDKSLARAEIVQAHKQHCVLGEPMSIDRYGELERIFNAYKTLGGNGTAERLFTEIKDTVPHH